MIRIPRKLMAAVFLSGTGIAAQAVPTQIISSDVTIDYDADTFTLNVDGYSIDPASFASVTSLVNGVRLDFNGYLNLYATSYFNYSPETKMADYSALFSFLPNAGKTISGFTITYEGGYSIETPGSVSANDLGMAINESQGGGQFSITSPFAGPAIPALAGQLSATGDIGYVQVFDHYEDVFVGNQQVLDYCEVENPEICYYHDEPIYEQVAVYRDEMDLGEATIYLNSITLTANVVPLPPSLALFASAVMGIGGIRKLKRK